MKGEQRLADNGNKTPLMRFCFCVNMPISIISGFQTMPWRFYLEDYYLSGYFYIVSVPVLTKKGYSYVGICVVVFVAVKFVTRICSLKV